MLVQTDAFLINVANCAYIGVGTPCMPGPLPFTWATPSTLKKINGVAVLMQTSNGIFTGGPERPYRSPFKTASLRRRPKPPEDSPMPFDQLKQLAEHLGKLQGDLLRQVGTEPYAGFSEHVRQFQDGLTQAHGEFAEAAALEQAAEEEAAAKEAAEAEAAAAAARPPEEPASPPQRPALHIPDMPEESPGEDGSVWKLDWSVMPDASSSGIRPPAPPPKEEPSTKDPPPKKEIWDDLSERS